MFHKSINRKNMLRLFVFFSTLLAEIPISDKLMTVVSAEKPLILSLLNVKFNLLYFYGGIDAWNR